MYWYFFFCGLICVENVYEEMVDGGFNRKECLYIKGGWLI